MTLLPDFKRFSAEDFLPEVGDIPVGLLPQIGALCIQIADEANALLEARLAEWAGRQVEVYGNPEVPNSWGLSRTGWCDKPLTHRARLFGIEKLNRNISDGDVTIGQGKDG